MAEDVGAFRFAVDVLGIVLALGVGALALGLVAAVVEWWGQPAPLKDGESTASRIGKLHW